jgi:hypothetical protein
MNITVQKTGKKTIKKMACFSSISNLTFKFLVENCGNHYIKQRENHLTIQIEKYSLRYLAGIP